MGEAGRVWARGDEARMTAEMMSQNVIEVLDKAFDKFEPRDAFDFYTITDRPAKYIKHKLTGY
jgi:hypothetical protein